MGQVVTFRQSARGFLKVTDHKPSTRGTQAAARSVWLLHAPALLAGDVCTGFPAALSCGGALLLPQRAGCLSSRRDRPWLQQDLVLLKLSCLELCALGGRREEAILTI